MTRWNVEKLDVMPRWSEHVFRPRPKPDLLPKVTSPIRTIVKPIEEVKRFVEEDYIETGHFRFRSVDVGGFHERPQTMLVGSFFRRPNMGHVAKPDGDIIVSDPRVMLPTGFPSVMASLCTLTRRGVVVITGTVQRTLLEWDDGESARVEEPNGMTDVKRHAERDKLTVRTKTRHSGVDGFERLAHGINEDTIDGVARVFDRMTWRSH